MLIRPFGVVAERGLGGRVVGKQGVDKASWGGSGAGPGGEYNAGDSR